MPSHSRGVLIALAAVTAWAFTAILISLLLNGYPIAPLTLAFWRDLFIGLTVLGLLRVFQPAALTIARRDLPFLLLYGLGLALFNGLWTFSVAFNGAAVATVLAYSSPAFTVLLARLILRERLTALKLLAVALSLAGCVLVANAYRVEAWQVNPLGIVIGLGSGLAFAAYSLAGRWSAGRFASAWTVTGYGFLFAAVALAVTQTPASAFSLGSRWGGWGLLLFLALAPSLLGFGLYTLSLRYLPASNASLIATLEPVLTALIAMPALGEYLNEFQWLGAGLIVLAAFLAQWPLGSAAAGRVAEKSI
jgi:drug/metabolite transporter (DMT)-like permease